MKRNSISSREKEIIELITLEYTTKEIANSLYVSVDTIKILRKNIMNKLVVREAFMQNLIHISENPLIDQAINI